MRRSLGMRAALPSGNRPAAADVLRGVRALVFDMDGLLLNTEQLARKALRSACVELGLAFDEGLCAAMIGVPVDGCRQLLLERYGNGLSTDAFFAVSERHLHARIDAGEMRLQPGGRELLAALRRAGLPRALATSSSRRKALHQLQQASIAQAFDAVVTRDDVARGKPHPDLFAHAAKALNMAPAQCLALEDSYNGVRAAHAAGMPVIMVPDMLGPTQEMHDKCLAVVSSLHDVHLLLADSVEGFAAESIRAEGAASPLDAG